MGGRDPLHGIRCVTFDIDDTLYLERDYVRSGFTAVGAWAAEHIGLQGFDARAWECFEAGSRGRIFDEVLRSYGLEPTRELTRVLVGIYRSHDPSIELLPDTRACLEHLAGTTAIAVVSDGPLESQRAKVRALDLERWADPIILTDELGSAYHKPHPRAFELVEARTGARRTECLYVGDNPAKDFQGPLARGWRTALIRRAGGLHVSSPTPKDMELVIDGLEQLERAAGIRA